MVKSIVDSESIPDGIILDLAKRESMRILHVDDDTVFLEVAKQCLEIEGRFQVDTTLSVGKAMERMKKETYDAVISDYIMPGKDGLEFLKELRDSGNNIPFIIFTGKGREELAIKALNLGADGYFSKIGSPETVYGELSHGVCQIVENRRAEKALSENESYLKAVLDSIFTGLIVIDEETHKIVDANSHALKMIGASREDVIGKTCHRFICPAEKGKCPITDLGQTVDASERVLLRTNGAKVPILKTVKAMTWRSHKYLTESFVDVTEHKKREGAIQESQENFKRLFMGNPEATVYMDTGFRILDVNPRFVQLFGYAPDEVKGRHIDDFVVPEIKIEEGEMLDKKALEGYVNYDTVRKRKDGSLIHVSVSGAPITVEGKTIGYLGVYTDTTERKRYEERLSALNNYSQKVNTAESMEEIYRLTMDAVEKTLGFEIAFFMVVDEDTLCVVDHRGYPQSFSIGLPLDGTKKGVSVKAAKTGRSVNVPDAQKDDDWVEFMPGIRSALDVPVKIGSRVLGVIGADSKELNAFDEKDQELLEILASHAATAISNLEHARNLETYAREIRVSRGKFERLFLDNPEAAVYVDPDFHALEANPRFNELFGYSVDEIKGKRLLDLIVPEDKKEEAEMLDKESKKAYTCFGDTVRRRKDGALVSVSVSAAPVTVEGQPVGFVGVYKDITERKLYEKCLSALNTYGRNLNMAESMEEIYELTLDAMEKTLGFEFADIFIVDEKTLRLVTHRGETKVTKLSLPLGGNKGITIKSARTGKPVLVLDVTNEEAYVEGEEGARSELAVPIKIGPRVLGVLNVESRRSDAFSEKDQELLEILASHAATAITNLEYARNLEMHAREIRESQEKFRRLFLHNPEAAVYLDSDFCILEVNPRFSKLFGYSLDETKGRRLLELIVPENKKEEGEMLDRQAKKAYTYHDTVRKRKDGTLVPVSISAAPINVGDQTMGYVGLYRDITEAKRYEGSLSALNAYSRDLNMAKSMEEICELTLDAAEKTLGFEFADFLIIEGNVLRVVDNRGRPGDLSIELPLDGDRGITVKAAKTGKPILVPDISKEEAYIEFGADILSELGVPIKIGDRVLGVLNVESKRLNAFNEKDQELLEILASHAATAISNLEYAKNLEAYAQEIRESQQRFERLFMDNPEAAVHLDSSFHILNVNPRFTRLFGYRLDEIKGNHINDIIVPKEKMEEAVAIDKRACKEETYHEDTVRKRKDGSLVTVAFSAAPIMVENQAIGHIAVYKDISQLKKAEEELRQTLEKLAKMNEKLRVIGGLTRHDARNKLSAITGNVYLAKKKLADNNEVLNNLRGMEAAAEQMVRIFDFAKTYEMIGVEEMRCTAVEKMVNEAVSLFSDLRGVKVNNKCSGLTVLADSLLRQLFYNLIDNSLKYGEKIKTITVYYKETDDNKLKLVYEDDGVGIAEAEKKKLFHEGYGRGTGYGLYLIRKMCEGYCWNIEETGEEGVGVQFTITIPRIGEKGETNYNIR